MRNYIKILAGIMSVTAISGCTATQEITTTTAVETTASEITTTPVVEEEPVQAEEDAWLLEEYADIYNGDFSENSYKRIVLDSFGEWSYDVNLVGLDAARSEDGESLYVDGFEVVTDTSGVIFSITGMSFASGKYVTDIHNGRLMERYKMGENELVVFQLPKEKYTEIHFAAFDEGHVNFFNTVPVDIGAEFAVLNEENAVIDIEKNIRYNFDFGRTTYTAEQLEAPVLTEYVSVFEMPEEKKIVFLTDEQYEVFEKSLYITRFMDMASVYSGLSSDGMLTNEFRYVTDVSFNSFREFIASAFTEEATDAMLGEYCPFRNIGGRVVWGDGARGGDLDFHHNEYSLISADESCVKFRNTAYYAYFEIENPTEFQTTDTELEMVKTDSGWRMKGYDLWY